MKIFRLLRQHRESTFLANAVMRSTMDRMRSSNFQELLLLRAETCTLHLSSFLCHPVHAVTFFFWQIKYVLALNSGMRDSEILYLRDQLVRWYAIFFYGQKVNADTSAKLISLEVQRGVSHKTIRRILRDVTVSATAEGGIELTQLLPFVKYSGRIIFFVAVLMFAGLVVAFLYDILKSTCVDSCVFIGAAELLSMICIFGWMGHKLGFQCCDSEVILKDMFVQI